MKSKILTIISVAFIFGCSSSESETQNSQPETKSDANDYYENGNIRIERKRLENGDSLWIFKQEDGGCWEENFYHDGGIYKKIVYNSDCTKSADYELKDGKRHGYWKSYHENGKLREEGNYEKGISEGIFTYYDEKGKIYSKEMNIIADSGYYDPPAFTKMNFYRFKKFLKGKVNYKIEEDIKVGGGDDYIFPAIFWDNSTIDFHYISGHDSTAKFSSLDISDKVYEDFPMLDLFPVIGTGDFELIKYFASDIYKNNDTFDVVHFHNLGTNYTYSCYIRNQQVYRIVYSQTELRY